MLFYFAESDPDRAAAAASGWEIAMKARCVRLYAPVTAVFGLLLAPRLDAQSTPLVYDPIVVTATRDAQRAFDVPASVDVIDGALIRSGQPAINLSESLVRVPGVFCGQSPELRAGPADQLARVRSEGDVRRAWSAAVSGRYSGDDARWARPDRQLQPLIGGPGGSAARPVLHALRQCFRRGDLGVHGERHAGAGAEPDRQRGQLRYDQPRR
jgi:hypothetical protein